MADVMNKTHADMCVGEVELKQYIKLPQKPVEQDVYPCKNGDVVNYLFFSQKNRWFSVWNKMITKEVLNNALPHIKKIADKNIPIFYGEDNIFSTIFAYYTKKVVNCYGSKYHYTSKKITQHFPPQEKQKIIKHINSLKTTIIEISDFLIDQNVFDKYYKQYTNHFKNQKIALRAYAIMHNLKNDEDLKNVFNFDVEKIILSRKNIQNLKPTLFFNILSPQIHVYYSIFLLENKGFCLFL